MQVEDQELEKQVAAFVAEGKFHPALNVALSGLNACRRAGDAEGVARGLERMRRILDDLEAFCRAEGSAP
jgi:hypothetical protein